MSETETCHACGAVTPHSESGATHRYLESSAGCWAAFGALLAREYSDPAYVAIHARSVDAYAAQHPGTEGPQTISSINVHLASMLAYFELGMPIPKLAPLKASLAKGGVKLRWFPVPESVGEITVMDVLQAQSATEHIERVEQWARCTFDAWAHVHDDIRRLIAD